MNSPRGGGDDGDRTKCRVLYVRERREHAGVGRVALEGSNCASLHVAARGKSNHLAFYAIILLRESESGEGGVLD